LLHDSRHRPARDEAGSGDRLLVTAIRQAGPWLAPLVVLAALEAAATLALPAALGRALDEVIATHADGAPDTPALTGALALTAGLIVFLVLANTASALLAGVGTARSTGRLRRRLVRHVLGAGPALTQRTAEGDLVARLVGSSATAARAVVVVAGLTASLIPPAGAVVALAVIDPWLALTFCAGMVVVTGAVRVYLRDSRAATAGYLQAQGSIAARLVDALAGARTIAAARTTRLEVERVLRPLPALRRHGIEVWHNMARLAFHGEPIVLVTQVAVIAVAGFGLAAGRLSPGEMLAASRYAVMAAGIGGVLDELSGLTRARAGAQRVAEVLAEPAVVHGDRGLPPGPGELALVGISAGPADAPVLEHLDLVVPGGCAVALVGRSGAGKSLLAALAGRLCDPTAGQVRLDGMPLDQLDRAALRRAVTYAFERPALLGATVAEAIAFGVDRLAPERIRLGADAARADAFIRRLPGGYGAALTDTPMSGGEIQRIGLARALGRDARVLILDDATSSVDTATEAEIAAALTARMQGRTRLIVTHRAGTAARADLVAWLDGGRVRRLAPHHELWAEPDYRALFGPAASPVEPMAAPVPAAPVAAAAASVAGGAR
jgi:ATP-binding cassette subfamily B protein